MNPFVLIGLFMGAGLIFIAVFIAIASKFGSQATVRSEVERPRELPGEKNFD